MPVAEDTIEVEAPVVWSDDARSRLGRVPIFIRGRVERSAHAYAREIGLAEVSTDVPEHLQRRAGMPASHPPPS